MQIQQVIQTEGERVLINVKNVDGGGSLTTGFGVCMVGGAVGAAASADGINAVLRPIASALVASGLSPYFVGVAKNDIAINAYGLVVAWGGPTSVAMSFEADKTVGIVVNEGILRAGGKGLFTSALLPENLSTFCYKYVALMDTVNISGGVPYGKGFVRAL